MRLPLRQLHEIARTAGVPDTRGLPLSALVAAIAMEESGGDTRASSRIRDRSGNLEPSFGLLQIHEPSWPEIAAETKGLIRRRMPDYSRAVAQIRAAAPIFRDAGQQAMKAVERLAARGLPAGPIEAMLLMDAAWQGPLSGSSERFTGKWGPTGSWADWTRTGDPAEIRADTSPGRTAKIRAHLRSLGVSSGPAAGIGALLGFLGFGGLVALLLWALGEWADES